MIKLNFLLAITPHSFLLTMSIPIRPNAPGIMQCTTRLTPRALFDAVRGLLPTTKIVDAKGKDAREVQDAKGNTVKEIRGDSSMVVVDDPTLTVTIRWRNNRGYTEYQMVSTLRYKDLQPPPNSKTPYVELDRFTSVVPDISYVVGHVGECEARVKKHMDVLNPPVKKFARKVFTKHPR